MSVPEYLVERLWSADSLEDEVVEEEWLALAEQAEADRLLARASELAAHASERLAAVAAARAALSGDGLPPVTRHEEPLCRESLPEWL
ncbi:MAG TPA: hypothetical protein VMM78_02775 [Thermomicrobiales bacterium]|nr:hypothetical protein [Thermomicrobiales bacterium]